MDVRPDLSALTGTSDLGRIVGALLTYALLISVTMLIVSVISWALASSSGSWHGVAKAKIGLMVALVGTVLTGGALTWANWLVDLGLRL